MVFVNLREHEKEAFFSLLDEYFSARPNLFNGSANPDGTSSSQPTPAALAQRAFASNPEAAAKVMSAGFKHIANSQRATPSNNNPAGGAAEEDEGPTSSVANRIAALSKSRHTPQSPSSTGPPPVAEKPGVSSLVSSKKFGDVDVSSAKGFVSSFRSKPTSPPPQPTVPPAFSHKQNSFAPPPSRRVASSSPRVRTPSPEFLEPAPAPPPPPPGRRMPKQEEPEGEWVEALYEYDSGEAGDLKIVEGERILLTERTSDDWWTGQINGRTGLFPASYVKPI